jgi:Zn-dependent protease
MSEEVAPPTPEESAPTEPSGPATEAKAAPPGDKKGFAKKLGPLAAAAAWAATKIKTLGSLLLALLKFGKLGKILLTTGTMFVSVWAYAQLFGLWFAVGFVVLIFVHEMGHVWAAYKMGIPVSAPIFIPFMGALILTKKFGNKLVTQDAIIGIGGPALGTAGSAVCAFIYMGTGSLFFLALAYTGFFLNLFNLTPVYPLDGGWIVRAISPILWLLGLIILSYMVLTGQVRNPMIFILIILGIPTMWTELKALYKRVPSTVPADFRWKMGAAYVGLLAVCVIGMSLCLGEMEQGLYRRDRRGTAVALRVPAHRASSRPS